MCSKEKYVEILMRVGTILRPGINTDELDKLIREDFESDQQPRKRRKRRGADDEDEEQPEE